jgi:hypothetical protein
MGMGTDFQSKLSEIIREASAQRDLKKREWSAARKAIRTVLDEAAAVMSGAETKDSNGTGCWLRHGDDKLEFSYDPRKHKVVRTSTRDRESEYDPGKLTPEAVENEVEEFVRAVLS